MRAKNFVLGLFWVALSFIASASSGKTAIVDSINAAGDPALAASWNVPNVGWQYTPTFSYSFFSIGTKFGSSDGRTVTAEIFSGTPGSLTLLTQGTLVPAAGAFAFSTGFSNTDFVPGETYFLGFRNVQGLLVNFADYGPGATNLGGVFYDFGTGLFNFGPEGGCCSAVGQPIIEFVGNPPLETPLPAALPLFTTGLGALGLLGWRRKRKQAASGTC